MVRDIVNPGSDALLFQTGHERIPFFDAHNVQVVHRTGPTGLEGCMDRTESALEQTLVFGGAVAPPEIPLRQMLEFHVEKTGLDAALGIDDIPGKLERLVTGY